MLPKVASINLHQIEHEPELKKAFTVNQQVMEKNDYKAYTSRKLYTLERLYFLVVLNYASRKSLNA